MKKQHILTIAFFAAFAVIATICFTFPFVSKYEQRNQPQPEQIYVPDTLCLQQLEMLQKDYAILQDSIARLKAEK